MSCRNNESVRTIIELSLKYQIFTVLYVYAYFCEFDTKVLTFKNTFIIIIID